MKEPKITSIRTITLSFEDPVEFELPEGYRILDVVTQESTRLGVGNAEELRRVPLLPIVAAWDGKIVERLTVRAFTEAMPVATYPNIMALMAIGTCLDVTGQRWWFFAATQKDLFAGALEGQV